MRLDITTGEVMPKQLCVFQRRVCLLEDAINRTQALISVGMKLSSLVPTNDRQPNNRRLLEPIGDIPPANRHTVVNRSQWPWPHELNKKSPEKSGRFTSHCGDVGACQFTRFRFLQGCG